MKFIFRSEFIPNLSRSTRKAKYDLANQNNSEIFASNGIRISLLRGLKIKLTDVNEILAYGTILEVKFNLNSHV